MGELFIAGLVLLVCVAVVFVISRCWIALVDALGARLFGRFKKKDEPPVWHTLDDSGQQNQD